MISTCFSHPNSPKCRLQKREPENKGHVASKHRNENIKEVFSLYAMDRHYTVCDEGHAVCSKHTVQGLAEDHLRE